MLPATATVRLLSNLQSFFAVEFNESADFAMFGKGSRKAKGKMPNCTPGKSWSCGFTCLPMSKKNCGSPLPGQAKNYADYLSKQAIASVPTAAKPKKSLKKGEASKSEAVQHKPMMSEADAIAYTKDSAWKDRTFFHGTNQLGANAITGDGIDMKKNLTAVYGQGFYMGGSSKRNDGYATASSYGQDKDPDDFTVLEMRVNVKNPRSLTSMEARTEISAAVKDGKIKPPDFTTDDFEGEQNRYNQDVQKLFKDKGYDGLHITDLDYFVAFDPKQVAIYARHDNAIDPPDSVAKKIKQDAMNHD